MTLIVCRLERVRLIRTQAAHRSDLSGHRRHDGRADSSDRTPECRRSGLGQSDGLHLLDGRGR